MDINDIRIAWTVSSLAAFCAIVAWAWSRDARAGFDEAALLPFMDEARPQGGGAGNGEDRK